MRMRKMIVGIIISFQMKNLIPLVIGKGSQHTQKLMGIDMLLHLMNEINQMYM